MKKNLIALFLTVAFAVLSLTANAGVAPTAKSSAPARYGAKIAAVSSQSSEGGKDKKEHRENTPKESVK